jgi:hypothetical protein
MPLPGAWSPQRRPGTSCVCHTTTCPSHCTLPRVIIDDDLTAIRICGPSCVTSPPGEGGPVPAGLPIRCRAGATAHTAGRRGAPPAWCFPPLPSARSRSTGPLRRYQQCSAQNPAIRRWRQRRRSPLQPTTLVSSAPAQGQGRFRCACDWRACHPDIACQDVSHGRPGLNQPGVWNAWRRLPPRPV